MFEIKDGIISLNKTRKLTPKQLATLNNCYASQRNAYLMSLLGITKARVHIPRIKNGYSDPLYNKHGGSMLKLMDQLRNLNQDHIPSQKDIGQWIGVEIECFIPHDGDEGRCGECDACQDGDSCSENESSENDAHHKLKKYLKYHGITRAHVKYDGSLSDDEGHGVEITILFNSKYGFDQLNKLCKALQTYGCYINKTCGLHVHMDARHLTARKVTKIGASIGHALPILKWLVPESRRTNTYCKLVVSSIRGDRYSAVNLTAFRKYKTIEIRLHQGSLNSKKIRNWIE